MKNKSPKTPTTVTNPAPTPVPVTTPEPTPVTTPVTTPEPTPVTKLNDQLIHFLQSKYLDLMGELRGFRLLTLTVPTTFRQKIEVLEQSRQVLKRISGLTVALVTSHGSSWDKDEFDLATRYLRDMWCLPTLDTVQPIEEWPAWNKMVSECRNFNPQVVRRLLVMNGLRFEFSQKPEREKTVGNPWGKTLKEFKAWVSATDTPSLSIWDRLVPSVDKIPTNAEALEKLKKAYTSLKDLGF